MPVTKIFKKTDISVKRAVDLLVKYLLAFTRYDLIIYLKGFVPRREARTRTVIVPYEDDFNVCHSCSTYELLHVIPECIESIEPVIRYALLYINNK